MALLGFSEVGLDPLTYILKILFTSPLSYNKLIISCYKFVSLSSLKAGIMLCFFAVSLVPNTLLQSR